MATRLGITIHSLYAWIKAYGPDSSTNKVQSDIQIEFRPQKEQKRDTNERDILKKPWRTQGLLYTSYEWQSFQKSHRLEGSMSCRGKRHDNAVAENFSSY